VLGERICLRRRGMKEEGRETMEKVLSDGCKRGFGSFSEAVEDLGVLPALLIGLHSRRRHLCKYYESISWSQHSCCSMKRRICRRLKLLGPRIQRNGLPRLWPPPSPRSLRNSRNIRHITDLPSHSLNLLSTFFAQHRFCLRLELFS